MKDKEIIFLGQSPKGLRMYESAFAPALFDFKAIMFHNRTGIIKPYITGNFVLIIPAESKNETFTVND